MAELYNKKKKQINATWENHQVRQYNGPYEQILLDARKQVPSKELHHDDCLAPSMIYMPDKGRLLIQTAYNDWESYDYVVDRLEDIGVLLYSDDMGKTWHYGEPLVDRLGQPVATYGPLDMVYLGKGEVFLLVPVGFENEGIDTGYYRFLSKDWGETWEFQGEMPMKTEDGRQLYPWTGLYKDEFYSTEDGFCFIIPTYGTEGGGTFRFSSDTGEHWTKLYHPDEFEGISEISFVRAKNGDLVAALRYYDVFGDFATFGSDHSCGLKTAYSTDNGLTWSDPQTLFQYGRMHADLVSMPNGDIVMTYIVRRGYPQDEYGHIQAGMEAVVSHDFGRTWDLDHRYILDDWAGSSTKARPSETILNAGQSSSTILLSDNSLMTICASGVNAPTDEYDVYPFHRAQGSELHLVHWRLNEGPVNDCRIFTDADPLSDLRNKVCNRATLDANLAGWMKHHRNIALPELGVTVAGSESDRNPDRILEDRYSRRSVFFVTCPAWFEISFLDEKCIDGVVIHPGVPPVPFSRGMDYIPTDYTIKYLTEDGQWKDVIPPVVGKKKKPMPIAPFFVLGEEVTHEYSFEPIVTKKLRFDITNTSDNGSRNHLWEDIKIPEQRRRTAIRKVEILEKRD